jgi:hypothetical protein
MKAVGIGIRAPQSRTKKRMLDCRDDRMSGRVIIDIPRLDVATGKFFRRDLLENTMNERAETWYQAIASSLLAIMSIPKSCTRRTCMWRRRRQAPSLELRNTWLYEDHSRLPEIVLTTHAKQTRRV